MQAMRPDAEHTDSGTQRTTESERVPRRQPARRPTELENWWRAERYAADLSVPCSIGELGNRGGPDGQRSPREDRSHEVPVVKMEILSVTNAGSPRSCVAGLNRRERLAVRTGSEAPVRTSSAKTIGRPNGIRSPRPGRSHEVPVVKMEILSVTNAGSSRSCVASLCRRERLAVRTGLEPATSAVTGRCSNQIELPDHRLQAGFIWATVRERQALPLGTLAGL